jgi:hypothetical protein
MRKIFICILFYPICVFSQTNSISTNSLANALDQLNHQTSKALFNSGKISITDESIEKIVHDYYKKSLIEIQKPTDDIKLLHSNNSKIGHHFHFQQTSKNIPIYGATFDITLTNDGNVLSSFNNLINSATFSENNFVPDQTMGDAMYVVSNNSLIPAYKNKAGYNELINDINGKLVRQRDTRLFFNNDDTTVTGKVFLPDPLSSQSVIYGQNGTYQHFNDSDYALLNDQRILVSFPATFRNDSFYLANRYARIVDLAAPYTDTVKSKQPVFDYLRSKNAFKDLMAFYHVYATQMYYQSIGFNNLKNYQIKIDAQSGYADNSFFYFNGDSSLNFGIGGIPDAEDGDIPSHEYTHALSWFINATPNMSTERRAIEEGICDVIAAIRSKRYTTFNWRKLFNFDGANPIKPGISGFWGGRMGDSPKTYSDLIGDYYRDSEIWSSTILDISEQIGEDATAILMLTSIYSMPYNITMPQAANLFLQADSILNAKKYDWKIYPIFNARKLGNYPTGINDITDQSTFKLLNTAGFADGSGDAIIETTIPSTITVYSINGQQLINTKNISDKIILQTSQFEKGFYFIRIENSNGIFTSKITKF